MANKFDRWFKLGFFFVALTVFVFMRLIYVAALLWWEGDVDAVYDAIWVKTIENTDNSVSVEVRAMREAIEHHKRENASSSPPNTSSQGK
jgi:hypothetical protein